MRTVISAGTRHPVMLRASLGSLLPALLSFVGLTAVIVGILAMHVWMGGHGATAHHSAGSMTLSSTPSNSTAMNTALNTAPADPTAIHSGSALVSSAVSPVVSSGHTHGDAAEQLLPALTQAAGDLSDQGMLTGCGADCADEMALSMCVLALVLVGIAWLLTPTGRALTSSLRRRGPPLTYWASRPAPTPSLTQLCISRT